MNSIFTAQQLGTPPEPVQHGQQERHLCKVAGTRESGGERRLLSGRAGHPDATLHSLALKAPQCQFAART